MTKTHLVKVTDFIAQFLVEQHIKHVFMLTGGGAMHLNDSLGKRSELQKIYNHHEQASAMAAESYARLTGKISLVNVTTGPGGINTLNGVFGAWTDSLPMLVISGQVRFDTTTDSTDLPLRQLGDQECRIIDMVKGITKYAVMITDPLTLKYHLEKAIYLTVSGRPGPVWLDIPMNVQGAFVNPDDMHGYSADGDELYDDDPKHVSDDIIQAIGDKLRQAKRPVVMVGSGIRLAGMHEQFLTLVDQLKVPVVTAFNAHDVLEDIHPYYVGKPGTIGDRSGNFVVQNSDVLLILGCRLNIRQISYNWTSFARSAYKIMVDIDRAELEKPTLSIDLPVHANLQDVIPRLEAIAVKESFAEKTDWLVWCKERKQKYPVVLPEYWDNTDRVNPYCFMQRLGELLPQDQIIVTGDGTACVVSFQAIALKKGQRLYTNSGSASMGYDLPAAIGACVGSQGKDIVCLAGDGSIMQNIQELMTIVFNQYPIKVFILNNNGYHSIRQTQQNFFGDPLVGVGPESGLGFPDFKKLAAGFGLPYKCCHTHHDLDHCIASTLGHKGPIICEVMLDLEQPFAPKLSSRRLDDGRMVTSPLEDMAPFLSREELTQNMIVDE